MSAIADSNHPKDKNKNPKTKTFWRNLPWQKLTSVMVAIALCLALTACGGSNKPVATKDVSKPSESIKLTEVSPPTEIQRLSRILDRYNPQISILSPKPDQVLTDTEVAVKFDVKDLPIFKNAEFGLGSHIHVTLDNQEYKAVYDLSQAATFTNLSPGTHTIRAFASRPWHESFKNQGAYAQVSFNVLTKTDENQPDPKTPLLTYSRPVGTYGAEPIMLDFYIQNAPLHLLAQEDPAIDDWQIRATIDGQSFTFDRWEPIYLKGFKEGKNWVKLELIEEDGDAIANVFNSTAHLINYQPNGTDTLSRLVSGEKIANIEAIVDPNYAPPAPAIVPEPETTIPPIVSPVVTEAQPNAPEAIKEATKQTTEETTEETTKETTEEVVKETTKPKAQSAVIPVVPVTPTAPTKPVGTSPIKVIPSSPEPVAKPAIKVTPVAVPKNPDLSKDTPKSPEQPLKATTETKSVVKDDGKDDGKGDIKTVPIETQAIPKELSSSTPDPVKVIVK